MWSKTQAILMVYFTLNIRYLFHIIYYDNESLQPGNREFKKQKAKSLELRKLTSCEDHMAGEPKWNYL